jgi:hypothetical protein
MSLTSSLSLALLGVWLRELQEYSWRWVGALCFFAFETPLCLLFTFPRQNSLVASFLYSLEPCFFSIL